jgi:hypothetical protein
MTRWVCILCLLCWPAPAATHTAASTTYAAVSAALALCSDGDTLEIPAGNSTWSSTLTVTNGITISGAGTNSTTITAGTTRILTITAAGKSYKLSGIRFNLGAQENFFGVIALNSGYGRVTSCVFSNAADQAVMIGEDGLLGVIDHCAFYMSGEAAFYFQNSAWDGVGDYGDNSWASAHTMGTTNTCMIEDCQFIVSGSPAGFVDGCYGARWAMRFCTITNGFIIAHGSESSGRPRSVRQIEFYGNNMGATSDGGNEIRGGTGVMFSNILDNANCAILKHHRSTGDTTASPWNTYPNDWDCDTNAVDMCGMGVGDLLSGASPTPVCLNQAIEPWYEWANTTAGLSDRDFGHVALVVQNTHYFDDTPKPGYTPLVYPHPMVTLQDGGGGSSGPVANINKFIINR